LHQPGTRGEVPLREMSTTRFHPTCEEIAAQ
jgi:hypothetical protein